jgi:hypothetical protein
MAGRTKTRRWADDDRIDVSEEELTPTSRTPYLEAVCRGPPPTRAAKALLHPRPPPSGADGAASGRRAASRREGVAVDRGHNWFTAYRFAWWKAASRHTSASAAVDGSPPLSQMGGGRSSTGRRRVRGPSPWCHLSQCGRVGLRLFDLRGAFRLN